MKPEIRVVKYIPSSGVSLFRVEVVWMNGEETIERHALESFGVAEKAAIDIRNKTSFPINYYSEKVTTTRTLLRMINE